MTLKDLLDCLNNIEDKDLIVYVKDGSSHYQETDEVRTIVMEHDLKDRITKLVLII